MTAIFLPSAARPRAEPNAGFHVARLPRERIEHVLATKRPPRPTLDRREPVRSTATIQGGARS
jgi:hypothetical protein